MKSPVNSSGANCGEGWESLGSWRTRLVRTYGNEVPLPSANAVAAAIRLRTIESNEAEIAGNSRRRLPKRIWGAPFTHPTPPLIEDASRELRPAGC